MSEREINRLEHLKSGIKGLPFKETIAGEDYVPERMVESLIDKVIKGVRKEMAHKSKN